MTAIRVVRPCHLVNMRWYVRYLLKYSYYYARAIGMLVFAVDLRPISEGGGAVGRVRKSRGITVMAILANLFTIMKVKFVYNLDVLIVLRERLQILHILVFFVLLTVRMLGMLISIAFMWKRRSEMMGLLREFFSLQQDYFAVRSLRPNTIHQQEFEWHLAAKLFLSMFNDLCLGGVFLDYFRDVYDDRMLLTITTYTLFGSYLNTVLNLYYFGLAGLRLHLIMLNRELWKLLHQVRHMQQQQIPFVCTTTCQQLREKLEALVVAHSHLVRITLRFNNLLDIQGLCVIFNLYMNNISLFYLAYLLFKSDEYVNQLSPTGYALMLLGLLTYYSDLYLFMRIMTDVVAVFEKGVVLLRAHLSLQPLDKHWESCLTNFNMQLRLQPLEHNMHGLFRFTPSFCFSIFVSSLSNSIILMQYDYRYY